MFMFNMKYVKMVVGPFWRYVEPVFDYFSRILTAVSQVLNAVLFGNNDQSLSSRCHEGALHGVKFWKYAEMCINFLWSGVELGHCERAFDSDTERSYNKGKRLVAYEKLKESFENLD